MKNYPVSRKDNLVVQEMDREILIYDLNDNKAFSLNETSSLVWELCDGKHSITEISRELSKKLKIKANDELVWLALDQLKKEKLIENEEMVSKTFDGMSRREVIKKVGLGTMIALPVVASITVPTSIAAASVCGANVGAMCGCDATIGEVSTCNGVPVTLTDPPYTGNAGTYIDCTSGGNSSCMCIGLGPVIPVNPPIGGITAGQIGTCG